MVKPSRTVTMESLEFRRELEQSNNDLLANRLKWYSVIRGGIGLLWILGTWANRATGSGFLLFSRYDKVDTGSLWQPALVDALWIAVYASAAWLTAVQRPGRVLTLRLSMLLILSDGLYGVALKTVGIPPGAAGIPMLLMVHSIAAYVFPWTAWQAARPVLIACAVIAARSLLTTDWAISEEVSATLFKVLSLPFIAVPGVLIALMLHSRRTEQYRYRFLRSRYGRLREELAYARQIHESLFPEPRANQNSAEVGFTYSYEPMRQIGGDFLFARAASEFSDDPSDRRFSVVLLDVTGHGIPAALTVNRLHGELELLYAQNPAPEPSEVMRTLNHYVHLTLAKHSIYVTGVCLRVDPDRGVVDFSNSGHPPVFLRAIDGTVSSLISTSFVLGACPGSAFDPGQASAEFLPGDSIVAYTDGATEARNGENSMLTIEGLRRLVAETRDVAPGDWPDLLMQDVENHRAGHIEDDTLFVELYMPVRELTDAVAIPSLTGKHATM